jgi:general secretion pathway protein I
VSAGGRSRAPGARAFTLLEVMVALSILAAALLAFSDVVGGALRNHVRATHLDVATLLARGKLAALEDEFRRDGFRDFDQNDDGTFEAEGHPEIRWTVEVKRPQVELGPDRILAMLAGGGDPCQAASALGIPQSGCGQAQPQAQGANPALAALGPALQAQLTAIGETIKKGVREVRLTIAWPDGSREESFTVVTHLAVLAPQQGAPQ